MYGNMQAIADAIAEGTGAADITVVAVKDAGQALIDWADLLVVGGPTHVHRMSRPRGCCARPGSRSSRGHRASW